MTDADVIMALSQAVALAESAYTRLYMLRNRTVLRRLPIRFWWFGQSLRIVSASADYANLLGCQVDTISGVYADSARAIAATAFAGNPSWTDYKSTCFLTSPDALQGLGIREGNGPVELGLSDCGAESSAHIHTLPLSPSVQPVESWRVSPAYCRLRVGSMFSGTQPGCFHSI